MQYQKNMEGSQFFELVSGLHQSKVWRGIFPIG